MDPTVDSVLAQAACLSAHDRDELICRLLASECDPTTVGETEDFAAELQRRVDEYRSGAVRTIPIETVLAELAAERR